MMKWMHRTPTEAAAVLAVGILVFTAGSDISHNADNGQNMRWIEAVTGAEITDLNLVGVPYTPEKAYMSGIALMFGGLFMTALGAWLLGRLKR